MIDGGKRNVLGVLVDAVDYEAATGKVLAAAREHRPLALTALAVHGVMTGVQDKAHGARLNAFDVVTPDGQPVRWALNLAGAEPSKFRSALPGEPAEIAARIKESGARLVLVGLGCPRQEVFAYAMRPLVDAPLLAVGAAFDYHTGQLRRPPAWMQRRGLEWLWRLGLEPGRLWKRYLLLNPAYLAGLAAQKTRLWRATPPPPATGPDASFAV